ncbi:MAG: hypothetical protein Kow0081_2560 [Candidatus Dojkabacteria bacterium]
MSCQEFDGGRLCDYDSAVCGNSKVEERIGETCDDGNSVSGDGCSEVCRSEGLSAEEKTLPKIRGLYISLN